MATAGGKHALNDSGDERPPAKIKAKKAEQTFLLRYSEKYPTLVASKKGPHYAHCTLCKSDFSVRSSGIFDCKRHCESASHRQFDAAPEAKAKQRKLTTFVVSSSNKLSENSTDIQRQTTRAEAMLCQIIADSNLPLTMADTLTAAMKAVFPDSKIAAG